MRHLHVWNMPLLADVGMVGAILGVEEVLADQWILFQGRGQPVA